MEKELSMLLEAAKQVGGAAWPILVRGAYVDGVRNLIVGPFLMLLGIPYGWGLKAIWRGVSDDRRWDEEPAVAYSVAGGIVVILALILGACMVYIGIYSVLAPERVALKAIIGR